MLKLESRPAGRRAGGWVGSGAEDVSLSSVPFLVAFEKRFVGVAASYPD